MKFKIQMVAIGFILLMAKVTTSYSQNPQATLINKKAVYQVHKATSMMKIDGKSSERSWQESEALTFDYFYRTEKPSDLQETAFKMLWDEEKLYMFFECKDKYITAREKTRDGQPYFDDCAEVFLIPSSDKIDMHLGFEVNLYKTANDFVFLNGILKNEDLVVKSFNPDFEVAVTIDGTINDNSDIDKGWTMEMAIPISNFHINGPISPVKEGIKWAFLALRQDRNDPEGNRKSTSTAFPLSPENPDVHDPDFFGLLEFVAPPQETPRLAQYSAEWESLKTHNAAPNWFADAKLGVYFHWGVYNVPANGNEWYGRWMYTPDREEWGKEVYDYHTKTYGREKHYHDFIPEWKGEQFDVKAWVDIFEGLGAKFIGTIAEHHDGFSLWESKVNPWNSKEMGPGIDIVKAMAMEVKKRNMKFMTTFHHGFHLFFYPKNENSFLRPLSRHNWVYNKVEVPQDEKYRLLYGNISYEEECNLWLDKLNEVIDDYCPDYIWMDFGQTYIEEGFLKTFLASYFNKALEYNKEVVVNTKGTYFPTDLAVVNVERATMEDITPDIWVTDFQIGSSWGYNQFKRTAIDPQKAIKILAEVVSKNGVMILAAAPMAEGIIPEEQVEAMQDIGAWLKLYGEAIYNTRPFVAFGQGPTKLKRNPEDEWNDYGAIKEGLYNLNDQDIRYTQNGKQVYAIQLGWPGAKKETILQVFAEKAKDLKIKSISVLGSKEKISWEKTSAGLKVISPKNKPAKADAAMVYKITLQ